MGSGNDINDEDKSSDDSNNNNKSTESKTNNDEFVGNCKDLKGKVFDAVKCNQAEKLLGEKWLKHNIGENGYSVMFGEFTILCLHRISALDTITMQTVHMNVVM